MAHYGQTVSAEWLLLTSYRHYKCPIWYLYCRSFYFPPNTCTDSYLKCLGCKLRPNRSRRRQSLLTPY